MTPPPFPRLDGTAPCAQVDPELFHPEHGTSHGADTRAVKKVCKGDGTDERPPCNFLAECFQFAVHRRVSGIWAGTTEDERRRFRQRNGIRAVPLEVTFPMAPTEVGANSTAVHGSYAAIGIHTRRKELLCDTCRTYQTAKRKERKERRETA